MAVDMASLRTRLRLSGRDPRMVARVVLAALTAANLVAAVLVLKPWAGSAEDLEKQAASLRQNLRRKQESLAKLRSIVNKVESARGDGDSFMDGYLLGRRSVSSRLLKDLDRMAHKAGIRQKEVSFAFEPIEGSDTLSKATMTANYEGTYPDLIQFLNLLDGSTRLLIIESLAATPQPQGATLNTTMKFNAFVREGGEPPAEEADDYSPAAADAQVQAQRAGTAPDVPVPIAPLARPVAPVVVPPNVTRGAPGRLLRPGPLNPRGAHPPVPGFVQAPGSAPTPGFTPQTGAPVPRVPLAGPRVLRDQLRPPRPGEVEGRTE